MLSKLPMLSLYDVYPKIVPVGKEVTFTIRSMDPDVFEGTNPHVEIVALDGATNWINVPLVPELACTPLPAPMHGFSFRVALPKEDEYVVRIAYRQPGVVHKAVQMSVYALEEDLLCRTPLVGDFHMHTFLSDGSEGPAFVAAESRKNGYDFIAITDHWKRSPSLRAIAAFDGLDLPFRLYPGEEVHPHHSFAHIVNFGSDFSANDFARGKEPERDQYKDKAPEEWEAEIQKVMGEITDLPDEGMRRELASVIIISRIIRKGNGLCILAHPHWRCDSQNMADSMTEFLLQNNIVDALELLGGMEWYENQTQIAFYNDLRLRGFEIPVVGSSDEHGVLPNSYDLRRYFTEERTVVFAKENTRDEIIAAVKGMYSTTVLKYDRQYPQICGGSYRLQKYANFLLRCYFPLRDELYAEEGRLMHEYIAGTPEAKAQLLSRVAENAAFDKKYICR